MTRDDQEKVVEILDEVILLLKGMSLCVTESGAELTAKWLHGRVKWAKEAILR